MEKRYPHQARKVMHGIWGLGQAMFTKVILVVDSDVDVRDYSGVRESFDRILKVFERADDVQQRRLAAPRRSQHDHEILGTDA